MKYLRLVSRVVAVALCAVSGEAVSGGSLYQASVTFPFEVRWGNNLLPAGDYRMVMHSVQEPLRVLDEQGRVRALLLGTADAARPTQRAALLVTSDGSSRTVRSFNCPEWGLSFVYRPLTRAERNQIAFGEPAEAIAVRIAGR